MASAVRAESDSAVSKVTISSAKLSTAQASPAQAEVPSDDQVAAGRRLAEMVCGACHVVAQQRDELVGVVGVGAVARIREFLRELFGVIRRPHGRGVTRRCSQQVVIVGDRVGQGLVGPERADGMSAAVSKTLARSRGTEREKRRRVVMRTRIRARSRGCKRDSRRAYDSPSDSMSDRSFAG